MTIEHDAAIAAFRSDLAAVVDMHWPLLAPTLAEQLIDDGEDPLTVTEAGDTFPAAWVMVVAGQSISDPDGPSTSVRVGPDGQLYHTTVGLLYCAAHGDL